MPDTPTLDLTPPPPIAGPVIAPPGRIASPLGQFQLPGEEPDYAEKLRTGNFNFPSRPSTSFSLASLAAQSPALAVPTGSAPTPFDDYVSRVSKPGASLSQTPEVPEQISPSLLGPQMPQVGMAAMPQSTTSTGRGQQGPILTTKPPSNAHAPSMMNVLPRLVIGGMNSRLFGIPGALFPGEFGPEKVQEYPTGSPVADVLTDIAAGAIGGFGAYKSLSGALESRGITGLANSALTFPTMQLPQEISNVVRGQETPVEAVEHELIATGAGAALHVAGNAIENANLPGAAKSILNPVAQGAILGAQPAAEAIASGKPIDWKDVATQGLTGTFLGAAGDIAARRGAYNQHVAEIHSMVDNAGEKYGVDPAFLKGLLHSENDALDPNAKSSTKVTGLAQFTEATAERYGVDRSDPASNIDGMARYARDLLDKHHGDEAAAIAEYKGVGAPRGGATLKGVARAMKLVEQFRAEQPTEATSEAAVAQPAEQPAIQPVEMNDPTKAQEVIPKTEPATIEKTPEQAAGSPTDYRTSFHRDTNVGEQHEPFKPGTLNGYEDAPLVEYHPQTGDHVGEPLVGVEVKDPEEAYAATGIRPLESQETEGSYFVPIDYVNRPETEEITRTEDGPVASLKAEEAPAIPPPQTIDNNATNREPIERPIGAEAGAAPQGNGPEIRPEESASDRRSDSAVGGGQAEAPAGRAAERAVETKVPSGTLQSTIVPGLHPLLEQDIIPAAKATIERLKDISERTRANLAPATAAENAEITKQALLAPMGREHRQLEQRLLDTEAHRNDFNRMSDAESVKFWLRHSEGQAQPTEQMADADKALRELYETSANQQRLAGLATGHVVLPGLRENYSVSNYEYNPRLAEQVLGHAPTGSQTLSTMRGRGGMGQLRGSTSHLKAREMTPREHLEAGEVPKNRNPFDAFFRDYEANAAQNRTAHYAVADLVKKGIGTVVDAADDGAIRQAKHDGLVHPMDPSFTVRTKDAEGNTKEHQIWVPPESKKLIDNFLSKAPYGSDITQAFNALHNVTTLMGVTHASITAVNFAGNRIANTASALAHGEFQAAMNASFGKFYGNEIYNEYLKPGSSDDPSVKEDVQWLEKIGAGAQRSPLDYNHYIKAFSRSLSQGNYLGAVPRGALATVEQLGNLTMHGLVPRAKLDAWRTEYRTALANLPEDATEFQKTKAVSDAWHSIDDRMGEVWRNRSFADKRIMAIADLLFPRVNWTLGTYKALGKAGAHVYEGVNDAVHGRMPNVTSTIAFFPAIYAAVAPVNVMLQYMMTGKFPWETDTPLADMFLGARNGGTLKDGSPSRTAPISYARDLVSLVKDPTGTIAAKMTPVLSAFNYWRDNKDFKGDQVYDPNANVATQAQQVGAMFLKQAFEPFAVSNLSRLSVEGAGRMARIASMAGITPVSVGATESEAGKILQNYYTHENAGRAGLSPDQRAEKDKEKSVLEAYRKGADTGDAAWKDSGLSQEKGETLFKRAQLSPFLSEVQGADLETAADALRHATPVQKAMTSTVMKKDVNGHATEEKVTMESIVRDKAINANEGAGDRQIMDEFHFAPKETSTKEEIAARKKEMRMEGKTPSELSTQTKRRSARKNFSR